MTEEETDTPHTEGPTSAKASRKLTVITVSSVVTAVATTIIALLLLYVAFVAITAANEMGDALSGSFDPPIDESFEELEGDSGSDSLEGGGFDDTSELQGEELEAELDELESEFGPGPEPSAIREQAELEANIPDDMLRRYGLGVCFGVFMDPEHLASESGLTEEEAERMVSTAESWCSAR